MTTKDLLGVTATLETSEGAMTFEFFADKAPRHVKNFIDLCEKGFYDDTVFHRVIDGFMIQGGCPDGTGMGGPGYKVAAEFNDTPHVKGILSMARSQDPNSAGSQFFVVHGNADFLNNQYTAFGRLIDGEDTLDRIAKAPVGPGAGGEKSRPKNPVKIKKATIQRN